MFIAFNVSVGAPTSGQSCTAASLLPHHPAARAPRAQAWCARGSPRLLGGHDAAVWTTSTAKHKWMRVLSKVRTGLAKHSEDFKQGTWGCKRISPSKIEIEEDKDGGFEYLIHVEPWGLTG